MEKNKEKFPYEVDEGAVMDYVDGKFLLVVKDDSWNDEELASFSEEPLKLTFCYTNDIAIFVLEGGPIDSSDLYFNIQENDEKEALLGSSCLDFEVVLVDADNSICWKKAHTASKAVSETVLSCLGKQAAVDFMPGEYDVNVTGLQSAYEPFELLKYSQCEIF